jgi:hypothetical protein
MRILLSLIPLGLWLADAVHAIPVADPDPPAFRHNSTLHRRNNINKYGGCDKAYDNGKGRDIVYRAYQDMLKMTQYINPFLTVLGPDGGGLQLTPGVLENRFFGDITGHQDRRDLIHRKFYYMPAILFNPHI